MPIKCKLSISSLPLVFALLFYSSLGAQTEMPATHNDLERLFNESEVFPKIFTGFALYDPEEEAMIYTRNADKYFTPASNTKLFTFYTAQQVLGDSMPLLHYAKMGDTLVIWGTGNPLLLHPEFPEDTTVLSFLRSRPEQLLFSGHNFRDERFGPGWSWSDYRFNYQVERSPFPMYGNVVRFSRKRIASGFRTEPAHFGRHVVYNPELSGLRPRIVRREHSNIFEYNGRALSGLPFETSTPFRYAPTVIAALLSDTLGRPVRAVNLEDLALGSVASLHRPLPDTLYRRLMQESDNFIAEQLMLMCAQKLYGEQNADLAIQYARDSLLAESPDELVWRDGSGLSRYNLFTPRSIVHLLDHLYKELKPGRLKSILPAGGVSGTIENWYGHGNDPYVFAKTGTLSNKHCLSGLIVTKRGKNYLFSFMNNNYINGSSEVKREMEKVLEWIYDSL